MISNVKPVALDQHGFRIALIDIGSRCVEVAMGDNRAEVHEVRVVSLYKNATTPETARLDMPKVADRHIACVRKDAVRKVAGRCQGAEIDNGLVGRECKQAIFVEA